MQVESQEIIGTFDSLGPEFHASVPIDVTGYDGYALTLSFNHFASLDNANGTLDHVEAVVSFAGTTWLSTSYSDTTSSQPVTGEWIVPNGATTVNFEVTYTIINPEVYTSGTLFGIIDELSLLVPMIPCVTPTTTPTITPTATDVPTSTATATDVPTSTATATDVPTSTATATDVPTNTATATNVPTNIPSATSTSTTVPAGTLEPTQTSVPPTSTSEAALGSVEVTVITSDGSSIPDSAVICVGDVCQTIGAGIGAAAASGSTLNFANLEPGTYPVTVTNADPYLDTAGDVTIIATEVATITVQLSLPDSGVETPVESATPVATNPPAVVQVLPNTGGGSESSSAGFAILLFASLILALVGALRIRRQLME